YRPSFRPADTFLPIREKGLTYKQFCIAIHLFGHISHTYPNKLCEEGGLDGVVGAVRLALVRLFLSVY
ncbi:MAG: hypothetical protein NT023_19825, partial [Armatimonadetes bacterium]|nr:hypothetical protein [Armatimonadota bacterium]